MTEPARALAPREAAESELLQDVRHGFAQAQKELPPRWFYDARGSALFEEITRLPEYYPTRTERALLEAHAGEIVQESGARALVELGAGNADKTRTLLRALPPGSRYVPVDISEEFLHESAERLRTEFPQLAITPVSADITRLPARLRPSAGPVLFAFLGSTIGNFSEPEAVALLTGVRERMRAGDALLLGADLVKDVAALEAAYDDAQGVTAAFNLNLLEVLNRELGANFDPTAFRHIAFFDTERSRVEMHLVSRREQQVHVPGAGRIDFARGESIRTEISCKYTRASLERILAAAGFRLHGWRTDESAGYALLTARPAAALVDGAPAAAAGAPASVEAAAEWIRQRLLPRPVAAPRVGAEYELLVQHRGTHLPAQWDGGSGPLAQWLAGHASADGWTAEDSPKGAPRWKLPGGGKATLEPGGQLEYATAPHASAEALIEDLQRWLVPLERSAVAHDLELLAVGIDPHNTLGSVPLQFTSERYTRMAQYFARRGAAGGIMMRQTASLQLNLDVRADVAGTWRLANALPPYLTVLFANSARYAGAGSAEYSARAAVWRELDPLRTGVLDGDDPADAYARFALAAPAMLRDGRPFAANADAYDEAAWEEHLGTLFPELRLRGYLELRTLDALPLADAADAIRLVCTLLWNDDARAAALALVGAPDAALLERAGRVGAADALLRERAAALLAVARAHGAELSGARCAARTPLPR